MKVHKRINYYHNRHRSDGVLIEKREKKKENETEDLLLSNQEVIKSSNLNNNNFSHTKILKILLTNITTVLTPN